MINLLGRCTMLVLAAALAVLIFEGGYALVTGHSFLRGGGVRAVELSMRDRERAAAAALTEGPYSLARDPEVAFTVKPSAQRSFYGVECQTDAFGSRARTGPEPHPEAYRVVLVGDSVTFGFGLEETQILASRIEDTLGAALPADAPSPVVYTVAVPGWNVRNSVRALSNRLGALNPDLVVFTPVQNDLFDSFATTEAGYRDHSFDPALGGLRPHVSFESYFALLAPSAQRMSLADSIAFKAAGGLFAVPPIATSAVSAESRRRWQEMFDDLEALRLRLDRLDARLLLNPWFDQDFECLFVEAARTRERPFDIVPPFTGADPADRLEGDPHPSAMCVEARACCIARWLGQRDWIPGLATSGVAALSGRYASRWQPELPPRSVTAARSLALRSRAEAALHAGVDLDCGRGFQQIYGGVRSDFTVGVGVDLALKVSELQRDRLPQLRIERLPLASAVYPLGIEITCPGQGAATPTAWVDVPEPPPGAVAGDAALICDLDVPLRLSPLSGVEGSDVVDFELRPSNRIRKVVDSTSQLVAFRLCRFGYVEE